MAAVLLIAGIVAGVGPAVGQASACGPAIAQDDAGSGRDAGDAAEDAVHLVVEDTYHASLVYPQGSPADTNDWFSASWDPVEDRRVMVNVSMWVPAPTYDMLPRPAPHLDLAAYAPGAEEPTHVGEMGDDGVVRLDFHTDEGGTWLFHVSTAGLPAEGVCHASAAGLGSAPVDTYSFYWGCHPHCVEMSA